MTVRRTRRAVDLTPVGFGGAAIGNLFHRVSDETAAAAVDAAWAAGIRYFDTAPYYGFGLSESRLGELLASHPRGDHVVSTKVGKRLVDEPGVTTDGLIDGQWDLDSRAGSSVRDYSRDGILASLDGSLTRLKRDHIDIVYIHDPDDHCDQVERETAPVLAELRDQGVISAFGVGTSSCAVARRLGESTDLDAILIAGRWTLVDRGAAGLLTWADEWDIPVAVAAPFNSGLLASAWPADGARFDYAAASPDMLALARKLASVCRRYGTELPTAALQFSLRSPLVAAVVVGMASQQEVVADMGAFMTTIPEELWKELDRVLDEHVRRSGSELTD